jgi:hypothetical protein
MPSNSFNPRGGLSFGYNHCRQCAVRIPKNVSQTICRCCAADSDPANFALGADTEESPELMAPAPRWSITGLSRFPQMENVRLQLPDGSMCDAALWWLPKGGRWVAQHPLEYPRNRLRSLTDWDSDQTS